jgi:hypothetical protein
VLVAFLYTSVAQANVLSFTDRQGLAQPSHALLQVMQGLLDSARATSGRTYECLMNIQEALQSPDAVVAELIDLIDISVQMRESSDEAILNNKISIEHAYLLKALGNTRSAVNLSEGYCHSDSVIAEKAENALRLLNQIEAASNALQRKLTSKQP